MPGPNNANGDAGDLSSDSDLPSGAEDLEVRHVVFGRNRPRRNPPRAGEREEPEIDFGALIRNNCIYKTFAAILEELFPGPDGVRNRVNAAFMNLQERPCCAIMYGLVGIFGFFPVMGFIFFITITFVITLIWVAFCQALAVVFGAVFFGGFFVFLVFMCALIGMILGTSLHVLFNWGWLCNSVADIASEISPRIKRHMESLSRRRQAREE